MPFGFPLEGAFSFAGIPISSQVKEEDPLADARGSVAHYLQTAQHYRTPSASEWATERLERFRNTFL
jgi:hypothetical protein